MDLRKLSRRFDDIPISDAYTGAALYLGQVSSFIDSQVDGTIATRRVLSLDPDHVIPTHRCINYLNEKWLVGDGITDGLQGQALRTSYAMKKVLERYTLASPGQAALGLGGLNIYGQRQYLKSTVNGPTDAEYNPFWHIYISQSVEAHKGYYMVSAEGEYFKVRSKYSLMEGFQVLESDQINEGWFTAAVFQGNTYDPITETTTGDLIPTTGILVDAYMSYSYQTQAEKKYVSGDNILIIAKIAVTPKVGQSLTINSRLYKVFTVSEDLDSWKCLVRLA
jgi:hypothetical protein